MSTTPQMIGDYLRMFAGELEERILAQFPALHNPTDPVCPALERLRRRPYPA